VVTDTVHTAPEGGGKVSVGLPTCAEPAPATDPVPDSLDLPLTVIEPRTGWAVVNLQELWRYRELLFFLAWRDVKIRYKQTALGLGWAVAQPLATMAVFALFLGRAAGVSAGIEHYPLYVFAGMVGWAFFSNTVSAAGMSVISNERLVTKIYFPRLIIPLSTVGVGLFDLGIATGLLGLIALAYGVAPGWSLLALPFAIIMLAVAAAGVGVLLSALVVAQRDFKYVLTFGVQLWMFATPCVYMSSESLHPTARMLLPLNPAYGLIQGFRDAALGGPIDVYSFELSSMVGVVIAFVGLVYFRRVERSFADTI
jgi:lipopolysaccharide transport system permease protein